MKLCMGCMNEYSESQEVCPVCGKTVFSNPAAYLSAGSNIAGRYIIGSALGRSDCSVTYISKDTILGRKTVIREYFPINCCKRADGSDEIIVSDSVKFNEGMKSFALKTKQIAGFADHTGAPKYLDLISENNTVYAVREYIDGRNAAEIIGAGLRNYGDKINILRQIINYVAELHAANIPHGSIKPENIIIKKNSEAVLTDFAIPFFKGSTMSGFTAPEVESGARINEKSDIYSLSAVAYYLFTGNVHKPASERFANDSLKDRSAFGDEVSDGAIDAIISGMSLSPDDRIGSVWELSEKIYGDNSFMQMTAEISPSEFDADSMIFQRTIEIDSADVPINMGGNYAPPASGDMIQQADRILVAPTASDVRSEAEYGKTDHAVTQMMSAAAASMSISGVPSAAVKDRRSGNKVKILIAILAAFLLAVLIFGVVKHISGNKNSGGISAKDIRVPDFCNGEMSIDEAKEIAEGSGLFVDISDSIFSDDVAEGIIYSQDPKSGTVCAEGTVIHLTVSAGQEIKCLITENYVGMKADEAKKMLEEYGIIVTLEDDDSSLLKKGIVSAQSVESGEELRNGDTITFKVSTRESSDGEDIYIYTVPDFIGHNIDELNGNDIKYAKYFVYEIEYKESDNAVSGIIFEQSIKAGDEVSPGTEIKLSVSKGKIQVFVPNVVYKSESDARAAIEESGLSLAVNYRESDDVAKGHVISQDPPKDSKVHKGDTVTIVVSSGSSNTERIETAEEETEEDDEPLKETEKAEQAAVTAKVSPAATTAKAVTTTKAVTKATTQTTAKQTTTATSSTSSTTASATTSATTTTSTTATTAASTTESTTTTADTTTTASTDND